MSNSFLNVLHQAASYDPNNIKPWQPNWSIELITFGFAVLFLILIWLWARSGRSKHERKVPFERTAEDFAGTVQAGYGQIPYFLITVYVVIAVTLVLYIVNSIITGTQY